MPDFLQVVGFDPLIVEAPKGDTGDTGATGAQGAAGNPALVTVNGKAGPTITLAPADLGAALAGDMVTEIARATQAEAALTALIGASNGQELARFEERNGTNIVLTTTITQIMGSVFTVPATTRQVAIDIAGQAQITTAGAGALVLTLEETTTGAGVILNSNSVAGTFTAGTWSKFVDFPTKRLYIGTCPTPRTFALYASVQLDAASSLAASLRSQNNLALPPFVFASAVAL